MKKYIHTGKGSERSIAAHSKAKRHLYSAEAHAHQAGTATASRLELCKLIAKSIMNVMCVR